MNYLKVAAILLIVMGARPARACLNDRETVLDEREFRSRYESPESPGGSSTTMPADSSERFLWNPRGIVMASSGAVLIVAAIAIAARKPRV